MVRQCFTLTTVHIVLTHEYTTCLGALMRFPPVEDVHSLVQQGLHVREPHVSCAGVFASSISVTQLYPPARWMVEQLSEVIESEPQEQPERRQRRKTSKNKGVVAGVASTSGRMIAAALGLNSSPPAKQSAPARSQQRPTQVCGCPAVLVLTILIAKTVSTLKALQCPCTRHTKYTCCC